MNAPVNDLAHGKDLAFAELRAKREMDTSPEGEVTINLGISAAWVDLLGGRVDLIVDNISTTMPHVRAGNARILGLTSRDPTMGFDALVIGSQLSGYVVNSWNCLGGPVNLPAPMVSWSRRLSATPQCRCATESSAWSRYPTPPPPTPRATLASKSPNGSQ